MNTANPALGSNVFGQYRRSSYSSSFMTVGGAVNKTAILLFLVSVTAVWTWRIESEFRIALFMGLGMVGTLLFGIITIFSHRSAPATAPMYALSVGFFLGGLSALLEIQYPGVVFQAILLTFAVMFCLLLLYKSKVIRATENFKLGIVSAIGAIFVIYIASFILSFVGVGIPYIHESGYIGIAFSLFVVTIAALSLVLDFDFIERSADSGAPKHMEWYAAFALIVTLVWLYVEILRLLIKIRSHD